MREEFDVACLGGGVAGEALAPTLLAAYPQTQAIATRSDGTSMTFTAKLA